MRTFLIIALSLLAASMTYHFLICPRLCPDCSDPVDVNLGEYLNATNIYFKGFDGATAIEIEHVVQAKSIFAGKLYPLDSIPHSFVLKNGQQLKYKIDPDTTFNTIIWEHNPVDTNFRTYLIATEITTMNSIIQCQPSASREVIVSITASFATILDKLNVCQDAMSVCEDGNPSNCVNVNFGESFTFRVAVNPITCKANGFTLRCDDGTVLGKFSYDDPDDLNIRIVLGGMFSL